MRKLTNEEFLERARKKHGDKYEYPEEYVANNIEITIICPIHGETHQTPISHLQSTHGCRDCSFIKIGNDRRKSLNKFINEGNLKFDNKFDYSKFIYSGVFIDGIIICPEHGDFPQSPHTHLKAKYACPKCSGHFMDTEYFLEKANKIHNNKYKYPDFKYSDNNTYINIECPEHGIFPQTTNSHLDGGGCPDCKYDKMINTMIKKDGQKEFKFKPLYNSTSIKYLNIISEKLDMFIQHALNDGEKRFKRYWIDGYISYYNICIEWNEKHHYSKKQMEKDLVRENYIKNNFGCHFININEKEFLKDIDNQVNIVVDKIKQIINK